MSNLVDPETVYLEWLLQAGFIMSNEVGSLAVDPYLSNMCERLYGLRRRSAAPYDTGNLPVETVLVTHWHEDHLDLDSALGLAAAGVTFIGPPSCALRLTGHGVPADQVVDIAQESCVERSGFSIRAVPARHAVPGFLTEDAVGYVVSRGDVRIYHSGDTEYDRTLIEAVKTGTLTAALVCINGSGGNMNSIEAATLVAQLRPAVAIPMHFGLWQKSPEEPDDRTWIEDFRSVVSALAPHVQTLVMDPQTRIPLSQVTSPPGEPEDDQLV